MDREDVESLKQFVDKALAHGWAPSNGSVEGTFIMRDPLCVRIAVASPIKGNDSDLYVDWLSPLHDIDLAKAAWGQKLSTDTYLPSWRHHQHQLLDLLQTAGVKAYCEYLQLTT